MPEKKIFSIAYRIITGIKLFYLDDVNLPFKISFTAVVMVFITFFASAERIMFICDPYTIEVSGIDLNGIKRKGLREHIILRPIELSAADFTDLVSNAAWAEGYKRVIVTAHLFAMADNYATDNNLKNTAFFLFGPLFDYFSGYPEEFNVSLSIPQLVMPGDDFSSEKLWNNTEKVIFMLLPAVYEKIESAEPEKGLISFLSESYHKQNAEGQVYTRVFDAGQLPEIGIPGERSNNSGTLAVFLTRSLDVDVINYIRRYNGKTLFSDFINCGKLSANLFRGREGDVKRLYYDYDLSMDRILKEEGIEAAKGINYYPVFTFSGDVQKK